MDQHKYRDEIIELLAAGWSPRSLNQMLGRLHPDYVPVARSTLNTYRREKIDAALRRPLEEFSRKLRDEHVLLDPIRERATLIVLQEARVQRALELEKQLGAQIVLPVIGGGRTVDVEPVERAGRGLVAGAAEPVGRRAGADPGAI